MTNPPHDAEQMFRTAESFHLAAVVLYGTLEGDPPLVAPFLVNLSFATEIYIKSLLVLTGRNNKPRGHRSNQLFLELSQDDQQNIKTLYSEVLQESAPAQETMKFPDTNFDIEHVLELAADAFIEWRYTYEGGMKSYYGVAEVAKALRNWILTGHRPDWRNPALD